MLTGGGVCMQCSLTSWSWNCRKKPLQQLKRLILIYSNSMISMVNYSLVLLWLYWFTTNSTSMNLLKTEFCMDSCLYEHWIGPIIKFHGLCEDLLISGTLERLFVEITALLWLLMALLLYCKTKRTHHKKENILRVS